MKKKILIISGDPNSINSEVIYKSWKKLDNKLRKKIYYVSNFNLLSSQFKKLKYNIRLLKVDNLKEKEDDNGFKIINLDLNFTNPFNVKKKDASKFVKRSLSKAHKLALNNEVNGIINCPISKKLLNKKNMGVTELLASKCKVKNGYEAMIIRNKNLSVCPVSTHIDIKNVSKKISTKLIINKIKTINKWFKEKINIKPKIGILGLNPHNAEFRNNSEEKKIIIPAIKRMKKLNLNVTGPLVADTIFIKDYKKFDVILGMYHDQVLAPFKSLFKFDAINVTLGLKYIRVSPDHGVALELIKKNKANAQSLLECINFVNKFGK